MKARKIIYSILIVNQISFLITVFLFITIWYGFIVEIFFGIIQVLSSLVMIFFWKKLEKRLKDQLTYYWMMVLVYFSLWLIDWNFLNEIFLIVVGIVVVPMTIAGYLIYIISSIKKSLKA